MTMKTTIFASMVLGATAFVALPVPAAHAQKAGQPSYQELLERVERLEQQAGEREAAGGEISEKDVWQDEKIAELSEGAKAVSWTFDNLRPTIKTGDGRFSMALRARAMFDTATFKQKNFGPGVITAEKDLGAGSVVRRARFGFDGTAWRDFKYEFLWEFGGSGAEAAGLYQSSLTYAGIPNFSVTVGVFKPKFSFSENTSSNDIAIIERPGIVNTVVSGFGAGSSRRAIELQFQKTNALYGGDNIMIAGAFTGDAVGTAHGTDESSHILGRAAYRFYSDPDMDVQVGASGSRIMNVRGGTDSIQLRERPNIRVDGGRLSDTAALPALGGYAFGFEGVARWRNVMLYGEWYKMGINRSAVGVPDPDFGGWYVEGSWILTGERKTYSPAGAVFNNPKVVVPVSYNSPGWGAWELTARYDVDDLNFREGVVGAATPFGGVRGGRQEAITAGLNWYLNNNVRMLFNYIHVDIDRIHTTGGGGVANGDRSQDVDIFGLRFHIYN